MMSNNKVLATAEHLNRKVVAITHGTSPLGTAICEHAAKAGASVFALDSDPTLLAQQSISFRQNNLRLRGMPCDLTSQVSITNAVIEIVSHAPPIDYWIHAQIISPINVHVLNPAMLAFGQHFDMRGKGHFLVIGSQAQPKELEKSLAMGLPMKEFTNKAKIDIFIPTVLSPIEIAQEALMRLAKI